MQQRPFGSFTLSSRLSTPLTVLSVNNNNNNNNRNSNRHKHLTTENRLQPDSGIMVRPKNADAY